MGSGSGTFGVGVSGDNHRSGGPAPSPTASEARSAPPYEIHRAARASGDEEKSGVEETSCERDEERECERGGGSKVYGPELRAPSDEEESVEARESVHETRGEVEERANGLEMKRSEAVTLWSGA